MKTEIEQQIKDISAELLKSGKVDRIIGYKAGSLPMSTQPCVIESHKDVDQLVWNSFCGVNLASYLEDNQKRTGIIAKGCDSRNVVNRVNENRVKRENIFLIGVPCDGMMDKRKIMDRIQSPIDDITETSEKVTVTSAGSETILEKHSLWRSNCETCTHPEPVFSDQMVNAAGSEKPAENPYQDIESIEQLNVNEKWDYFEAEFSRCIRCYACRNTCPLCYCPTCFVDESQPQWVGKGDHPVDTRVFHILRAFHCAGRCTDCGSCESVCPMNINMRALTKKLSKDCQEGFGWQAGLQFDIPSPLDSFNLQDPNGFIR